jgi:uncharacterized membrane protein YheB (UPF0754 family)
MPCVYMRIAIHQASITMKMRKQEGRSRHMYLCLLVVSSLFSTSSAFSSSHPGVFVAVSHSHHSLVVARTTNARQLDVKCSLSSRNPRHSFKSKSKSLGTTTLGLTRSPHNSYINNHDHERRHRSSSRRSYSTILTTTTTAGDTSGNDNDDDSDSSQKKHVSHLQRAANKFKARPGTYLLIPCVAAVVGWFTNWLAVQMIFYPVQFRGIPIFRRPEIPLGFLGWQGIVPCKTKPMSEAMVLMVSTQLLTVKEAFARLDPKQVATLLAPEIPDITVDLLQDVLPNRMSRLVGKVFGSNHPSRLAQGFLLRKNTQFLTQLTKAMQENIDTIFSLKNCVVDQMMLDRTMLGQLFRKCGQAELDFLTNSGLWFGFLLGLIQLVVALFWDNPWTLSVGGGIVGLATNWLALKWIFEPVDPVKLGPFLLQGKFLRRQTEVAGEFSKFFAQNILTSEQLWKSVLNDPTTKPAFTALFTQKFGRFVRGMTGIFGVKLASPDVMTQATNKALDKLPQHLPAIYSYMDSTLALEDTLRTRMLKMTSRQFERVLHPIFEQDELTLILAGAVLGFGAGLVQQGLETGRIKLFKLPNFFKPLKVAVVNLKTRIRAKIQNKPPPPSSEDETPSSTTDQSENNGIDSENDDDGSTSNEDAKKDDNDDKPA